MIARAASLAQAQAEIAAGAIPGAGLTLAMARGDSAPPQGPVLDISDLAELYGIDDEGPRLRIGALVTLEAMRDSALVRRWVPALAQIAGAIGSAPLRRLATVGGNVGWGAGDLVPVLLAHRARLHLAGAEMPVAPLPPRGLIEAVLVPKRSFALSFAEKVGLRAAFAPTLVTVAATAHIAGGRWHDVALALGGGAEAPRRLPRSEAALEGCDAAAPARGLRDALEREIRGDATDAGARERARIAANLFADGLSGAMQ